VRTAEFLPGDVVTRERGPDSLNERCVPVVGKMDDWKGVSDC